MITIDDIRLMLSNTRECVADMKAEGHEAFGSDTRNIEVFSFALSQHGEIERLKRERDEAYERAAQIADGFTCGGCGMDGKCSKAIRALKSSAPTNETGKV